jgi:hypothetical protein
MNHSDDPQVQITEFVIAYIKSIGLPTAKLEFRPLPGDGSRRLFWRITTPKSGTRFIAMENVPTDTILERENFAYLKIGTHLFQKGLPVPEIHRFDLTNGWFIMEDMGDNSLQEAVSSQKSRIPLYERVVEILFRLQIEGPQGFDAKWCYQTQRFDHSVMRRYEADYFRDAFLCHYLGMKKDWPELEVPFNHLADTASKAFSIVIFRRRISWSLMAKSAFSTGKADVSDHFPMILPLYSSIPIRVSLLTKRTKFINTICNSSATINPHGSIPLKDIFRTWLSREISKSWAPFHI